MNHPASSSATPPDSPWEELLERLRLAAAPRYKVTRLLGYGGMAGVYLAEQPNLGRHVAIKVISPALMTDPSFVERFHQEARTVARLDHPNIIPIFEVDQQEGLHFFVMRYASGRTLGAVMADSDRLLPFDVIGRWLLQSAAGLGYAHERGVIHRDIKPTNILLDANGSVQVTDFGIAKVTDEPGLTRTGILIGTPAYMSPEQCGERPLTPASDQYSLGAVAYEMITGQPPFTGPTVGVLHAHLNDRPRPIRELRPDCPPQLEAAVDRMLEKLPQERFPDMAAAASALGAAAPMPGDPLVHKLRDLAAHPSGVTIAQPPPGDMIPEGERHRVAAVVTGPSGETLTARRIRFSSSDEDVAWISDDGVVHAVGSGQVVLAASTGGARGELVLEVSPAPVDVLEVISPHRSLGVPLVIGEEVTLQAWGASVGSERRERAVRWLSVNPEVARVTRDGTVRFVGQGTAVIQALGGNNSARVEMRVTDAPADDVRKASAAAAESPPPSPPWASSPPQPVVSTPPVDAAAGSPPVPATSTGSPGGATSPGGGEQAGSGAAGRSGAVPLWKRPVAIAAAIAVLLVGSVFAALVIRGGEDDGLRAGLDDPSAPGLPVGGTMGSDDAAAGAIGLAGEDSTVPLSDAAPGAEDRGAQDLGDRPGTGLRAGEAGERTEAARADAGGTQSATRETQPTEPGRPAPPAEGSLVLGSALPAGGEVVIRGGGRTWTISGGAQALPPGEYALEARAPGHEPARTTLRIVSGRQQRWNPALEPTRPAAPAPTEEPAAPIDPPATPSPDDRTAAAAIREQVDRFIGAFGQRDAATVVPLLPASARDGWRSVLTSSDVTDFEATVADVGQARITGNAATVDFGIALSFRNRAQRVSETLRFQAVIQESGGTWRLVEVRPVG